MSYRTSSRAVCDTALPIPWWKKPFRWFVAWLQVRREEAFIEALRDKEREYYMLGGLVLVREMREIKERENAEEIFGSPAAKIRQPGPGRERIG